MSQNQGGIGDLVGAVKQNPEALLLLAAGCALMMRSTPSSGASRRAMSNAADGMARVGEGARQYTSGAVDQARQFASGVGDQARQFASDAGEQARRYTSDVADQARETVRSYASAASSYADQTRQMIGEQSQQAMRQTQSALQGTLDRVLRDQPLMVAFAGVAAGALLAAAFPTSRMEQETLGPVGERAVEAATELGGRLKDAASEATDTLKQSAERRGLTTDAVKGVASDVAGAFGERMSGRTAEGGGEGRQSGSEEGSQSQPGGNAPYKMPGA